MLRGGGQLVEGQDLLGGGGRRLTSPRRGAVGDRRDLLHPPQHLPHALGLVFRLGGERRGELHGGIQVGETENQTKRMREVLRRMEEVAATPPACAWSGF